MLMHSSLNFITNILVKMLKIYQSCCFGLLLHVKMEIHLRNNSRQKFNESNQATICNHLYILAYCEPYQCDEIRENLWNILVWQCTVIFAIFAANWHGQFSANKWMAPLPWRYTQWYQCNDNTKNVYVFWMASLSNIHNCDGALKYPSNRWNHITEVPGTIFLYQHTGNGEAEP